VADRVAEATATAAGQGGGAPAALVQIADHREVTIEELRRRIGLTHSSVVRLIDRLAARGLVRRGRGQADARTARLSLTPSGAATAAAVLEARSAVLGQVAGRLSAAGRGDLESLLDQLLLDEPLSSEHASLLCRLCCLRDCPTDRCPVEQRYRQLRSHGR